MKIFYVENETMYAKMVQHHLSYYQHEVTISHSPILSEELFLQNNPDIILIGEEFITLENSIILQNFNIEHPLIPILLVLTLSGDHTSLMLYSKVFVNYLFKEHLLEEIGKRLQITIGQHQVSYYYRLNEDTTFDYLERTLTIQDKKIILKPIEANILAELCKNLNQITLRETLLNKCWKNNDSLSNAPRYLDKYMVNIRKYLQNDPSLSVETIRNRGYCLLNRR